MAQSQNWGARPLSQDDVRGLREELSGGGAPTVWFTGSAVGVEEGRSGKVVALAEPAEGDFVQVRPAGSKDVLSFSVSEITVVKPPRKRKEPETKGGSAAKGSDRGGSRAEPAQAPARGTGEGEPATRATAGTSAAGSGSRGSATTRDTSGGTARRRPRQPVGATVTLSASPEGQWTVEVSTGKKRTLRPTAVPASAVAQAAKALHDDVAEAVEPLLEAAREQQRSKVEQLQQELAEAERMLQELTE